MKMTPSPWLFAFLKSFEKFRPTAYAATSDERSRGIWTIGWGHTNGVKEGDTCTTSQADEWLREDVQVAVEKVCNIVQFQLTQNQFDALVSLTFNIGIGAFSTSTLLHKLNAGDIPGASLEFVKWDKQKGVVLDGLLSRREAEQQHFDLAA